MAMLLLCFAIILSCKKELTGTGQNPDPKPTTPVYSFIEEFDSVGNLAQKGWSIINLSAPYGATAWRQGRYELGGKYGNDIYGFPAYSAVYNNNEFISADLNAGNGKSTLSCWLITRETSIKNGDTLSFYTRTQGQFPDRLQVRGNFSHSGTNIGTDAESVGDFTKLLLDINPKLLLSDYPKKWTRYAIAITGVSGTVKARFAFRYYVTNGGPGGANSDMIGIDRVEFKSK
ncbi:MAG: hypothetical protein RL732_671 [Bacteroidota bacterium]